MAEFYKFEIANWNEGTATLTLEQEAAYLRIVNAIRLSDQPITVNKFALCGLWRCNDRKAKRLLGELISAGKIRVEGGKIVNDKAVDDASNLSRLRADRASAGSRGGVESGKARSKPLKDKETGEAIASTRIEENRIEYSVSKDTAADAPKIDPAKLMFDSGVRLLSDAGISAPKARALVGKWRKGYSDESIITAIGRAQREGAIDPVAFIEGCLKSVARTTASKPPEIGEMRKTTNGKQMMWSGAVGQWVEVRE